MLWMGIVCSEFGFGGWLKPTAVEKTDQNLGEVLKRVTGVLGSAQRQAPDGNGQCSHDPGGMISFNFESITK
jgi:hypothetical protein